MMKTFMGYPAITKRFVPASMMRSTMEEYLVIVFKIKNWGIGMVAKPTFHKSGEAGDCRI
jgi:hypothetical protein